MSEKKFQFHNKYTSAIDIHELIEQFVNLKKSEIKIDPSNSSLINKCSKFKNARESMMKWLLSIVKNLNLKSETYFKCAQIFDLFISKLKTRKNNNNNNNNNNQNNQNNGNMSSFINDELYITSLVCLNIACKFEETNSCCLKTLKYDIVDKLRLKINPSNDIPDLECLRNIEIFILKTIDYKINTPNFFDFNAMFINLSIGEIINFYQKNISPGMNLNCIKNKNVTTNHSSNLYEIIDIQTLLYKFTKFNQIITRSFSINPDYIYVRPSTAGLICFSATIMFIKFQASLNSIYQELVDNIKNKIMRVIDDDKYLDKVEAEAFLIFYKLTNRIY